MRVYLVAARERGRKEKESKALLRSKAGLAGGVALRSPLKARGRSKAEIPEIKARSLEGLSKFYLPDKPTI